MPYPDHQFQGKMMKILMMAKPRVRLILSRGRTLELLEYLKKRINLTDCNKMSALVEREICWLMEFCNIKVLGLLRKDWLFLST